MRIKSIDLEIVNRMPQAKMLFGDGTCEICGGEDLSTNVGATSYCSICYWNRVENRLPKVPVIGYDSEAWEDE